MQNLDYFSKLLYNSSLAWWEWDITHNRVNFNDLKASMLGYNPDDFKNKGYQKFTELLHPDDYEKAMNAMRRVLKNETELYQVDYRILSSSSVYHWYMDRGTVVEFNTNGVPSKLRGIVIDLGKEAECGSSADAIIHLLEESSAEENEFMFTICSNCDNAKIDNYNWIPVTNDFKINLSSKISHGLCPACIYKLYPEIAEQILSKLKKK